jgi:hypothetical protein
VGHLQNRLLDDGHQIRPEPKRNIQLRKHEHGAHEHVDRIVEERRPATFEVFVADNLQHPTEDGEPDRNDPDPDSAYMTGNQGRRQEKRSRRYRRGRGFADWIFADWRFTDGPLTSALRLVTIM